MKILVNGINHTPELTGIGKYTGEMVKWLTDQGHEVRVITAPPYYPSWKIAEGYSSLSYRRERIDGAMVIRCPLWVPEKLTGIKRIVHLASFAFFSFPVILWHSLTWRPNIIFVVEPAFFCVPGALISAFLCRAKSWLHIQDFEIDAAFDLGIINSKRLKRWGTGVESWIMRRFDKVTTISVRMLDKLISKGVLPEKMSIFENWVETDMIHPMAEKSVLYQQLGLPENKIILLYSGNMGEKQGLDIIVEAARRFDNKNNLLFLMCGEGAAKERLVQLSSDLKNIVFIPLQPLERLNELLNIADIHLLPQKSGAGDLVMPSKLTNMMASGKPVIATAEAGTQIADVLIDSGIVVEPDDVNAFIGAIDILINDSEKCKHMGANGRAYALQHWERDNVISSAFIDFM